MNLKLLLIGICCVFMTVPAQAQLLKKLKQKAQDAAERTILRKTDEVVTQKTEKTIDDATSTKEKSENDNNNEEKSSNQNTSTGSTNSALKNHTEAKKAFYKEDVVIKLHENGKLNQTQYFDADQVAVRFDMDTEPNPGYIDSEAFMYSYDEKAGEYTKSSFIASTTQGMMVPQMLLSAYKLPPEPFMHNFQKQTDQGLTANPFNGIVEFSFVYEPEQFRYEDFKEVKQTLRGKKYTKFEYLNEPGYEGSYVLFDDEDRLVEIYTNKADTGKPMDAFNMDMIPPGESLLVYEYKPVDVELPPAKEVRSQGQGMMEMVYGSFNKPKNSEDSDDEYDTQASKGMVKSMKTSMKNHKVTADMLPESYDFEWVYKTIMIMDSRKNNEMQMNFLINTNANYQGSEIIDSKNKDMGVMTMVFDLDLNSMLMFMNGKGNQNMLQIFPIPEPKLENNQEQFTIKELSSKTILAYNCKGLQLENDKYTLNVYHATDAPISLSNFLSFSGSKNMNLPDLDPRLVKQFSNGLVMEMQYLDKKKDKNNFTITGQSLEKKSTSIKKGDYQGMDFLSGASMFKN